MIWGTKSDFEEILLFKTFLVWSMIKYFGREEILWKEIISGSSSALTGRLSSIGKGL